MHWGVVDDDAVHFDTSGWVPQQWFTYLSCRSMERAVCYTDFNLVVGYYLDGHRAHLRTSWIKYGRLSVSRVPHKITRND